LFQRIQEKDKTANDTPSVESVETYKRKLVDISRNLGKAIGSDVAITDSQDTIDLLDILHKKEYTLLFLTGKDGCSTCLDLELSRIRNSEITEAIIIGDYSLEKKLRFVHRKYDYSGDTFFTNLADFGLAESFLEQPTYLLVNKAAEIIFIQSTSYEDDYETIQVIFENLTKVAS
jgi:hypothetical protein